jgi:SAM-dependent methyltransferase
MADNLAGDVIGFYERHASAWVGARLREAHLYERSWFDRFCGLLPPHGSVLDLGCGAGVPIAQHLLENGFAVTGVDSSAAMIAMFQARFPSQDALVQDMRHLDLSRRFCGILAWDSFFHLSPNDQERMFPLFRAHAAPRAALMFTSGTTRGELVGHLEGEPLYHASLDASEYTDLLAGQGFDVVAHVQEDQNCGGRTVWLAQLR